MGDKSGTSSLPKPGEILHYDFRTEETKKNASKSLSSLLDTEKSIRLVQWNIERGYELPLIIKHLKELDGDIICLQEIDIHCERSGKVDSGIEIAKALNMNYYFICEFEELHHEMRDPRSQGGGVHGNGILTKFNVSDIRCIKHRYHPFNWELDGHMKREPRKGERFTLAAAIETFQGPMLCYTVHLEVFCGILGRISQFSEIFEDARRQFSKYPIQMILGDLNTMAHSIARLSKEYCTDHLRWKTLGQTEAQWWETNLISFGDNDGNENIRLRGLGLPQDVLQMARNPGFYDPFDSYHDVTLNNKKYYGLFQGKLDWVLLRGLATIKKKLGNHDYSASDHKSMTVDVRLDKDFDWRKGRVGVRGIVSLACVGMSVTAAATFGAAVYLGGYWS